MKSSTALPAFTSKIMRRGFFSVETISCRLWAPITLVPLASLARKSSTLETVLLYAHTWGKRSVNNSCQWNSDCSTVTSAQLYKLYNVQCPALALVTGTGQGCEPEHGFAMPREPGVMVRPRQTPGKSHVKLIIQCQPSTGTQRCSALETGQRLAQGITKRRKLHPLDQRPQNAQLQSPVLPDSLPRQCFLTYHEAVVIHVQHQVLTHHGQSNQSNVGSGM